jgi:hypothetical protein
MSEKNVINEIMKILTDLATKGDVAQKFQLPSRVEKTD